jgi:hypothetical protein
VSSFFFSYEQPSSGNSDSWLSTKLLLVLTNISKLRGRNVVPLSTPHLQLLCHLLVCFSDCRNSTSSPLPCCQAQDKQALLSDRLLPLSQYRSFHGQSAGLSLGAEIHIWVSSTGTFERRLSNLGLQHGSLPLFEKRGGMDQTQH